MANENAKGVGNAESNTSKQTIGARLHRSSPLSLASFFMFVLSFVYICVGFWKGFLPLVPEDDTENVTLIGKVGAGICVVIGISLVRLYISLWRIENDEMLENILRDSKTFWLKFLSGGEWFMRLSALIVMYFLIGNLTNTDFFRIFDERSEFCYLFVGVFAILFAWDILSVFRLLNGLKKDKNREDERHYFKLMFFADLFSLILSISYGVALGYHKYSVATHIICWFGGILSVVLLMEVLYSKFWKQIKQLRAT